MKITYDRSIKSTQTRIKMYRPSFDIRVLISLANKTALKMKKEKIIISLMPLFVANILTELYRKIIFAWQFSKTSNVHHKILIDVRVNRFVKFSNSYFYHKNKFIGCKQICILRTYILCIRRDREDLQTNLNLIEVFHP